MGIAVTNCRCTNRQCQKRTVKSMPLENYLKWPVCDDCGCKLRTDWYRNSGREANHNLKTGKTCRCGAPDYPHRKGSHIFCQHWDWYVNEQLDRQVENILLNKQVPVSLGDDCPF